MNTLNPLGRYSYLFAEPITKDAIPAGSAILDLERYWRERSGPRSMPSRQDIDPIDIPRRALPWIFMLDVLSAGPRLDYRFRLVGTKNVELVGRDATGHLASEIFGSPDRQFVMDTFDRTVDSAAPTFWRAAVPHDIYGQTEVYRGLLPLAGDGKSVDMLLCIAVPHILGDDG